jgi:hypothetical protein
MKQAWFGLFAIVGITSCGTGVMGPSGFLAGVWIQDTPGWTKVMQLQAVNGSVSGTIRDIGPQGPGGQQTINGTVTGTYSDSAFALRATYSGNVGGGTYVGQLGSDGRLTGIWTSPVAPYDTASFWFVQEAAPL